MHDVVDASVATLVAATSSISEVALYGVAIAETQVAPSTVGDAGGTSLATDEPA